MFGIICHPFQDPHMTGVVMGELFVKWEDGVHLNLPHILNFHFLILIAPGIVNACTSSFFSFKQQK